MGFSLGKALSFGLGGALFGGDKKSTSVPLSSFTPFEFGGVSGTNSGGTVKLTPTSDRANLIGDLGGIYSNQAGSIRSFLPQIDTTFNKYIDTINNNLLPQVQPGFGALSKTQAEIYANTRKRLQDVRAASTSNLKDDLARRKISGSSFAQDTLTRTQSEYDMLDRELAAEENNARARAIADELNATTQLIDKSFQAETQRIESMYKATNDAFAAEAQSKGVVLDDMNLVLKLGSDILNQTNQQAAQNSRFEAELAYKDAQAKAQEKSMIGGLIGGGLGMATGIPGGAMIGSALGSSLASSIGG